MKSILKYAVLSCLLGAMFSCTNDFRLKPNAGNGEFTDGIEIGLSFPDMQSATTRAMGLTPELEKLHIFLFLFDGNSLKQTIHIPAGEVKVDGDKIAFKTYLAQTDNDALLHIVALDDSDGNFAKQVNEVGYGLEDYVMPQFSVSGNQDAYWQRIELGCPIKVGVDNTDDPSTPDFEDTSEEVNEKLKEIKLVRNFARIKLTIDEAVRNFTVLGWTVVNDLDGGSVAPWYSRTGSSDIEYPYFTNGETVCNYDDLVGQGYPGVSYAGANFRNTLAEVSEKGGNNWCKLNEDIYLYDRKVVSVNPLYILIYGSLQGNPGYYKVALANRDTNTGLVKEYNVLRNIEYTIRITGVTAEGYPTPADAASGPAFNNVSGDVTTRSMLQISDGVDMLFVNWVTYVVTQEDEEAFFTYRFLENIQKSGKNENNGAVIWNAMADPNNAGVGLVTLNDDPSAVVTEVEGADDWWDERTGLTWKSLKLKFIKPTFELKEQKFVIYTPPKKYDDGTYSVGLSRTINLVVRLPWDYERVRIYPGEWSDDTKFPDWSTEDKTLAPSGDIYIGSNQGAALTLFFELPSGLPESMFPISFVIESDRQDIENAGAGNASVQQGESLFKTDQGVMDSRIQYVKTVLWSEYAPNGEASTPQSRIIRARFLTTSNMATSTVSPLTTTVRMHNPAFNDVDFKFVRKKDQPAS